MEQLRDYHRRMGAVLDLVEPKLHDGSRDIKTLSQYRDVMARTLTAYQLHVHREFYAPLLAGSPPLLDPSRIRGIKAECIALGEGFRAYRDHWAKRDIAADWDEYQPSAQGIMARVRRHIEDVERLLGDIEPGATLAA